jgi:Fe2+ or Zn2+ uptake regulation protein|tara:strand:- start:797 stop:1282 length:486 start_codon:yes stop_codon:yes gene_type:complete
LIKISFEVLVSTVPAHKRKSSKSIDLGGGHRMTPQRRIVYEILMDSRDHPTATEVFMRVQDRMPSISLATVYNCLDTLAAAGIVKQVNVDREPSRYCGNLAPHAHFHCETCTTVMDIDLKDEEEPTKSVRLPRGAKIQKVEVAVRGQCPECVRKEKQKNSL